MGGRRIVAVVAVLALAGGLVAYLVALPPVVADGYEERAQREHRRVERALDRVFTTLGTATFTSSFDDFKASGHAYVQALRRAAARDARALGRAKRAVRRARLELARVDAEAMTDGPSWPFLGGVGDVKRANAIADDERTYLRRARAYVRDYVALLEFRGDELRLWRAAEVMLGRVLVRIPASVADEVAYIDSTVRRLGLLVRAFDTKLPPEPMRRQHRHQVEELDRMIAGLRALSRALRRDGLGVSNKLYDRATVPSNRFLALRIYDETRLIEESRYATRRADLMRRQAEIQRAYRDL